MEAEGERKTTRREVMARESRGASALYRAAGVDTRSLPRTVLHPQRVRKSRSFFSIFLALLFGLISNTCYWFYLFTFSLVLLISV